jgi:protein TonB
MHDDFVCAGGMRFAPPVPRFARAQVVVFGAVVAAHAALLALVWLKPAPPEVRVDALSVSVALQRAPVAQAEAQRAKPQPKQAEMAQRVAEPEPAPSAAPSDSASPAAAPVPDSAPSYTAASLNNPRPPYPMQARRMGWEGRVVLNVEVLADGSCGAVSVASGSGHEVLDHAALATVQGWRFVPAHLAGQAVAQWLKVAISFSLEGSEA